MLEGVWTEKPEITKKNLVEWILIVACCLSACTECSERPDIPVSLPPKMVSTTGESPALSDEKREALQNLGYFERAETKNPEARKVTVKGVDASKGLNLYSSRHLAKAYLVDMDGEVIHTWSGKEKQPGWMHVEMLPDGTLLAIADYRYLVKVDWNSNVLWQRPLAAHHDLDIDADGRIHVLTYRVRHYTHGEGKIPIKDVDITLVSPKGKVLRERPLYALLRQFIPKERLDLIAKRVRKGSSVKSLIQENAPGDVLHVNSIQILKTGIPSIAPAGSFLMSVREVNRVVIVDPEVSRVLWSWGGDNVPLEEQHHATLLENGNITIFDNGVVREQSRTLEISPSTGKVDWTYSAPDFYSRLRGAAQRLPGGNMLITESDKGHVFEVTPDGKKVWEFWNPDIIGTKKPQRAVIYRMKRYPKNYLESSIRRALDKTKKQVSKKSSDG